MRVLAGALLFAVATPVHAQRDSVIVADSVIVTAERMRTPLLASTASVSRLDAADIALLPGSTIADVLRQVPGFVLVNFDGLGFDPQVMVRGFYGAGEAEYVTVLVDGRPVNQLHSGVVSWDALPLAGIEAIEVLRGSASSLYGDAAVGGVININTDARRTGGSIAGGSHDTWRGSVAFGSPRISGNGAVDNTDGWRDHAKRTSARGGVRIDLLGDGALTLNARAHTRELEEPGPLLSDAAEADATSSDDLFRFDFTQDRLIGAGLDARRWFGRFAATGSVGAEYRDVDATRTLALAPGFGDTRARDLVTRRAAGTIQASIADLMLSGDALTLGAEAAGGVMESTYYSVITGTGEEYRASNGQRGERNASGTGDHTSAALFAVYALQPVRAVRLSVGGRFDGISDGFEPDGGERTEASHTAFSPKAGINVRYADEGHVFANVSRTFKAPTLDQLFDQRPIPVPFPPFSLTTSNAALVPQYGTSAEAGVYQSLSLGAARASLTAVIYQIDIRDELDFDVSTLKFVNIGRSRHRGIESGVRVQRGGVAAFANYTLQAVTIRAGDNSGNELKAIPRHLLTIGGSAALYGIDLAAALTRTGSAWIDDANTERLPAWTRLDARVSHDIHGVALYLDVRNVLDTRYSTVSFFDPSGSGARYVYPSAGRVIELGIRH